MLKRIETVLTILRQESSLYSTFKQRIAHACKLKTLQKWHDTLTQLTDVSSDPHDLALCYRGLLADFCVPSYYFAFPQDELTEIACEMAECAAQIAAYECLVQIKSRLEIELLIFDQPSSKREFLRSVQGLLQTADHHPNIFNALSDILKLTHLYEDWLEAQNKPLSRLESSAEGVYYYLKDKLPQLFPIKILLPTCPSRAILATVSDLPLDQPLNYYLFQHILSDTGALIPISYLVEQNFLDHDNHYLKDVPHLFAEQYLTTNEIQRLENHSCFTREIFEKRREVNAMEIENYSLYTRTLMLNRALNRMSVKGYGSEEDADQLVYPMLIEYYEFYKLLPNHHKEALPALLRGAIEQLCRVAGDIDEHGDGEAVNYGTCIDTLRREIESTMYTSDPELLMRMNRMVLEDKRTLNTLHDRALEQWSAACNALKQQIIDGYFHGNDSFRLNEWLLRSIDCVGFIPITASGISLLFKELDDEELTLILSNPALKGLLFTFIDNAETLVSIGRSLSKERFQWLLQANKAHFWHYFSNPEVLHSLGEFNYLLDVRECVFQVYSQEISQLILHHPGSLRQIINGVLPVHYFEFIKKNAYAFIVFFGVYHHESLAKLTESLKPEFRELFTKQLRRHFPVLFNAISEIEPDLENLSAYRARTPAMLEHATSRQSRRP